VKNRCKKKDVFPTATNVEAEKNKTCWLLRERSLLGVRFVRERLRKRRKKRAGWLQNARV
jgi:hypothetical protein